MARIVHPGAGSRATKYRHVLDESLGLDDGPLAVLTVMLLRGAQTAAELRARTERLHAFDDLPAVEDALDGLAGRDEPLVVRLERRPGEREARWAQLLSPRPLADAAPLSDGPPAIGPDVEARVRALEDDVAELRAVVDQLRGLLD
jgi:uncharacterized protein YceH (UPF0502 family)